MPGLKVFTGSIWRAVGVEDSQWDVMTATAQSSSVALSWPTAGGTPSYYEISVDNSIINAGNVTSYTVSGLTVGQVYNFKVRPVYSDGSTGGWSYFKNLGPTGFNNASGGNSVTTVANYNGTGQTWKIHTFTSNGTFSVTDYPGVNFFRILLVGGGNAGSASVAASGSGSGGAGGKVLDNASQAIPVGSYSITVGGSGAASTLGALASSATGVSGGSGGAGKGVGADQVGNNGGDGPTSNITGSTLYYSGGGGGGSVTQNGSTPPLAGGNGGNRGGGAGGSSDQPTANAGAAGTANTGGGGGGGAISTNPGNPWSTAAGGAGGSGIVVISYRIA